MHGQEKFFLSRLGLGPKDPFRAQTASRKRCSEQGSAFLMPTWCFGLHFGARNGRRQYLQLFLANLGIHPNFPRLGLYVSNGLPGFESHYTALIPC